MMQISEPTDAWDAFKRDPSQILDPTSAGTVFFLFGIFCAYWAQTTNWNAWLWFFLGWFFAPITGIVLLYKNARDRRGG